MTEEDGRCLQVENGVVTSLANRKPIEAPIGWLDMLVSWELDVQRWGLTRSFATSPEFVWDGARIVGHVAFNENRERKIFLLIKSFRPEVTDTTINPIYRQRYRGELDLSTIEVGPETTTCSIMEGGVDKMMKANAGTQAEYPFDDESIFVKMDGMFIKGVYKWFGVEFQGSSFTLPAYRGMSLLNNDAPIPGVTYFDVQAANSGTPPDENSLYYFAAFSQDVANVRIQSQLPGFSTSIFIPFLNLEVYNSKTNSLRLTRNLAPNPPYSNQTLIIDETIDFIEGDRVFLRGTAVHGEFELTLSAQSKYTTTYTRAYRPFDMYRRLVNKTLKAGVLIPGVENAAVSGLLQQNNNLVVTCGDANRGIDGAKIKTNLNAFFDAYNAILNGGWRVIAEKLVFEHKSYFFNFSDPYHLGISAKLTGSFAKDLMGNVVKVGYPKQNINDTNGKYAFNNTHVYSTAVEKTVRDIELISDYITDPFVIEINRLNLEGKTTTDSNTDNDVIILNVGDPIGPASAELFGVFYSDGNRIGMSAPGMELVPGQKIKITGGANNGKIFKLLKKEVIPLAGTVWYVDGPVIDDLAGAYFTLDIVAGRVYQLKRVAYDNAGDPADFGIPSPESAFNIEQLTPKHMLMANGSFIRSLFWQFDNEYLTFNTTEGNDKLKTVIGGITIIQGGNLLTRSLDAPLFAPVYISGEIDTPDNLLELLAENPNMTFSVDDENGNRYVGVLRNLAFAPSTLEPQSFTLLSAPFNDFSKLIIR